MSMISSQSKLIALILILGIAGASIVGIVIIGNQQAQNYLEQTEISIESIKVNSFGATSWNLSLTVNVNNPSSNNADVGNATLDAYFKSSKLGAFTFPGASVSPGSNEIDFTTLLTITNATTVNSFILDFAIWSTVQITVVGKIAVSSMGLSFDLDLNKVISIAGMDTLSDSSITALTILDATNDTITVAVDGLLVNPSDVSVTLNDVQFEIAYQDHYLGTMTVATLDLGSGTTQIHFVGTMYIYNTALGQSLVSDFLSGRNVTLKVSIDGQVIIPGLTTPLRIGILKSVHLTSLSGVEVYITSIEVANFSDTQIWLDLDFSVYNPSNISGTLPSMLFDVLYHDMLLGDVVTPALNFTHGNNSIQVEVVMTVTGNDALRNMSAALFSGTDVELMIKASPYGNVLSTLLSGWNKTITLSSPGKFDMVLRSLGVVNSTETSMTLDLGFGVYNPTSVGVELGSVAFDVYWETHQVGVAELNNVSVSPGWNNMTRTVVISGIDSSLVTDMINQYMGGTDLTFNLVGRASDGVIGSVMAGLNFTIVLPAVHPADIAIISLDLYNATAGHLLFKAVIEMHNPTPGDVSVDDLNFTVHYQGVTLGNITVPAMTISPGTSDYTIFATFVVSNGTAFENLLRSYLRDEVITLQITGAPNGTDIISQVLESYNVSLTLPSIHLDAKILNLEMVNTTSSAIELNVTLSINNDMHMAVNLDYVNLTLYYDGSIIGNLTLNDTLLAHGENIVYATCYLTDYYNSTAISEMLSANIVGYNVTIDFTGEFFSDLGGLINTTNLPFSSSAVIPGVSEDFIQSVEVLVISIQLNPYSYSIDTKVTIYNPYDFDVNITSLTYDVYYDDNDGASYLLLNYPPKDNIYLDTINDSNTYEVGATSATSMIAHIVSSDTENAIRLYDEYYTDNDLHVDITGGSVTVRIGAFDVVLHFAYTNMYVPH